MFKNLLFKTTKPLVLGRWSTGTSKEIIERRIAMAHCDNCGTCAIPENTKEKFYIIVGEFYSKESAFFLKKRITNELTSFNSKKLYVKSKKSNKITLLSGPYNSINSMKNDYIQLKNFGFEELDISINE